VLPPLLHFLTGGEKGRDREKWIRTEHNERKEREKRREAEKRVVHLFFPFGLFVVVCHGAEELLFLLLQLFRSQLQHQRRLLVLVLGRSAHMNNQREKRRREKRSQTTERVKGEGKKKEMKGERRKCCVVSRVVTVRDLLSSELDFFEFAQHGLLLLLQRFFALH
jgi:hypothetical protein